MPNFSGRTTCHNHKFDDWKSKACNGCEAISMQKVLHAQWSNMPIELLDEVQELWGEVQRAHHFHMVLNPDLLREDNPNSLLADWLESKGVKKDEDIWMHYWW